MNDLQATAQTFDAETKKALRSCTFAALDIYGDRADWTAWGDFTRRSDAVEAIRMWGMAFRKGVTASIVSGKYRVIAKV